MGYHVDSNGGGSIGKCGRLNHPSLLLVCTILAWVVDMTNLNGGVCCDWISRSVTNSHVHVCCSFMQLGLLKWCWQRGEPSSLHYRTIIHSFFSFISFILFQTTEVHRHTHNTCINRRKNTHRETERKRQNTLTKHAVQYSHTYLLPEICYGR